MFDNWNHVQETTVPENEHTWLMSKISNSYDIPDTFFASSPPPTPTPVPFPHSDTTVVH